MTPFVEGALALLNIVVLIVTFMVKADISDLKAHMYEHFVTKSDMAHYFKRRRDDV
jgi:hypothetical protein